MEDGVCRMALKLSAVSTRGRNEGECVLSITPMAGPNWSPVMEPGLDSCSDVRIRQMDQCAASVISGHRFSAALSSCALDQLFSQR
jgi:hypothetical protein